MATFAAVDLGASSGRVIVGSVADKKIECREITRFTNGPTRVPEGNGASLYWDIYRIWNHVLKGLNDLKVESIESVGVDSWAVDYGLVSASRKLLGAPYSYRDSRTAGIPDKWFKEFPPQEFYERNGLQVLDFNTIFQLIAATKTPGDRDALTSAEHILLLPDLLNYWLSGENYSEITNSSSTGLINPETRRWSQQLLESFAQSTGVDIRSKLAPLIEAGERVGEIRSDVVPLTKKNGAPTSLIAVGSHDTASAVAAVPASNERFAYISCGTWSLVGLELEKPVLSEESRLANFTNELGVDGTVRYLHNIMGMWVLNGCVAKWREQDPNLTFEEIDRAAADAPALRTVVDINDPIFSSPGNMVARIDELADRTGQPRPRSIGEYVRCINESLALAHARAVREACSLADKSVDVIHMVGGGTKNRLLCQLTADACGLPVKVGPVEATSLGNLLVQARAQGAIPDSLGAMREVVRNSIRLETLNPAGNDSAWREAESRIFN
ncbi:MAG: rhamnulokinase family protein [Actinomycetaceae bacterium]|nr:rhamnulokinase family protein [Actinomycetaceae bacterium]